ncbi:MAG: endonuclease/exonuclease/phosphatase family protein [Nitrosopumilus sp.]|nr:endonuclease/exonuclease/phosphatase family protein [Nitrosopumilus sp.]
MTSFQKPRIRFNYKVQNEINNIRYYRNHQFGLEIPKKSKNHVIIATWNIANLGLQKRRDEDYQILAEIISWFDIIGIQEVHENLKGLQKIMSFLPPSYGVKFNDRAGNRERLAFLYDQKKVQELEMSGTVATSYAEIKHIKLPGINQKFKGFEINPHFVSFRVENSNFVIANAHICFREEKQDDRNRRDLEAYALARWASIRQKSVYNEFDFFLVSGDLNLPKNFPQDPIYKALKKYGFQRPQHSTLVAGDISREFHYDQIFFFPEPTNKRFTGKSGIFDFDRVIFPSLWKKVGGSRKNFRHYLRYYISDHRPSWAQFKIS